MLYEHRIACQVTPLGGYFNRSNLVDINELPHLGATRTSAAYQLSCLRGARSRPCTGASMGWSIPSSLHRLRAIVRRSGADFGRTRAMLWSRLFPVVHLPKPNRTGS